MTILAMLKIIYLTIESKNIPHERNYSVRTIISPVRIFDQCEGDQFSAPHVFKRRKQRACRSISAYVTSLTLHWFGHRLHWYERIAPSNAFPYPKEFTLLKIWGTHINCDTQSITFHYLIYLIASNWICLQPMRMYDKNIDSSLYNDQKILYSASVLKKFRILIIQLPIATWE